jgi:hypothetical protein
MKSEAGGGEDEQPERKVISLKTRRPIPPETLDNMARGIAAIQAFLHDWGRSGVKAKACEELPNGQTQEHVGECTLLRTHGNYNAVDIAGIIIPLERLIRLERVS